MGRYIIQLIVIGVISMIGTECQEFMTLNAPPMPPFGFHHHRPEELAMDFSEMNPVFLYASSQNDYIHRNRPDHITLRPPKRQYHQQNNIQRTKFPSSPSSASQSQRRSPITTPPLTYGFQPKLSTTRHKKIHQKPKEIHHAIYQNEAFRERRLQEPVYQATTRRGNQHESKAFPQNIQMHQNGHAAPDAKYQTSFTDSNAPFNYHPHDISPQRQFSSQTSIRNTPNINNQRRGNNPGENRNPINNHRQQNQKEKEVHRQESVRKPTTFENTAMAFKSRYNNQVNEGNLPQKATLNYDRQGSPDRNQNNDEKINMQHHARSMREENKPQLPPRPPFSNGGVKINTLAGELPVLHFDPVATLDGGPSVYLPNDNRDQSTDEQETKTYLLIKAPSLVTTERPLSAPFVVEAIKETVAPYIVNGFEETNLHVPEITFSTPIEPRAPRENGDNPPGIVLDLVQIPDHATYHQQEKEFTQSVPQSEFRTTYSRHEDGRHVHPTESYPTTPMNAYDDFVHHINDAFSPLEDNAKYQNKVLPKPKIKELKKPANFTALHPVSYSSSVSVVSVKQSVDAKQSVPKKQKAPLKKVTSVKKKPRIPFDEEEDYEYDDYGDQKHVPGEPGKDYPTHNDIPETNFECSNNKSPGFYADVETGCQVFHNCDTGMAKHSFMCPNGTIFHQELFICDWWYNVRCEDSPEFYSLNTGLFISTNNAHDKSRKKAS